jgi:two-component system OmpR family response regulator
MVADAKRVLVVEDEGQLLMNLRDFLARRGWDARTARTGAAAVEAVADFAPGAVLLDYQLPDMDGFQVLAAIRSRHPRCGCVLMTAQPLDPLAARARQHRIAHILSKPFSLADMEARLLAELAGS